MNGKVSHVRELVRDADPVVNEVEELVPAWLTLAEAAEALGVDVTRVRQLIVERKLSAIRRGERSVPSIPSQFIHEGEVVKHLSGTLTLLSDAHYSTPEAIRWLFTADDSLPGTPIEALRENRGTEVKRRAQALAF